MKQQNIPNSEIEGSKYFSEPNIFYNGQLLISSNFHPGKYADYYGKAIGYESRLIVIVFLNYSEEINTFLESILSISHSLRQIKFMDYKSNSPPLTFEKVSKTSIEKFQFANSNFSIIENFMNGLINSEFEIPKIKLASIEMKQTDLLNFFDNMNKIQCFKNLVSFSITDVNTSEPFPLNVFGRFLQSHKKIETVFVSNVNSDGSAVLGEICRSIPTIYEIHLNHLLFDLPLSNDVRLPQNVVLVDFSQSKFKNATLQRLLEFLTSSDSDASGLIVNMSHLEPHGNTFINAYKALNQTNCLSNISEANWSGNVLSPDLFKFLLSQKQLKLLSLMDLNVQKQGPFFQLLTQVVKKFNLSGIEIGSDSFDPEFVVPFIMSLKDLKQIEHFAFHSQPSQERIGVAVADLIQSLPNLKEVAVDIKKLSPEVFLNVVNAIASNTSITACSLTRCDVSQQNPSFTQIASCMKKIVKLKPPYKIENRTVEAIENKKKAELSVEKAFEQDVFDDDEEEENI